MTESVCQLGPFELLATIGQGAVGTVWRARRRAKPEQEVAVKVIVPFEDELERELLRREVQAVASLHHPNIITLLDFGDVSPEDASRSQGHLEPGGAWLAMELADGTLAPRHVAAWADLRRLVDDLLAALAHAHARDIIHRDLKPANLLVCEEDTGWSARIADFGLAHPQGRTWKTELVFAPAGGTPYYMAPEQFSGRWRDYGPWTDLYAIGCMVFELVAGHPPYQHENIVQLGGLHTHAPIPDLPEHLLTPDGLQAWLHRLIAKHPAERFQCAADARYAFARLPHDDVIALSDTAPSEESGQATRLDVHSNTLTATPSALELAAVIPFPDLPEASPRSDAPPLPESWVETRKLGAWQGMTSKLFGLREIPLVGRDAERDRIWACLKEVHHQPRPRALIFTGAAGSGKSRLLEWAAHRVEELGAACTLRATHSPVLGSSDGLGPMIADFLGSTGLPRRRAYEQIHGALRRLGWSAEEADADAPGLLAFTLPSGDDEAPDLQDIPRFRFDSSGSRRHFLQRVLRRLARTRPVLILLDDTQWGSEALNLAHHLLHEDTSIPILILAAAREDTLRSRPLEQGLLRILLRSPHAHAMELSALSCEDTLELLNTLLPLSPDAAQQLADVNRDHTPLVIIQHISDLLARELLVPSPDGFALSEPERPASITIDTSEDLWERSIERLVSDLDDLQTDALGLAAFLGPRVDLAEWREACAALDVDDLEPILDTLYSHGLAKPTQHGFAFSNLRAARALAGRAEALGRAPFLHRICAQVIALRSSHGNTDSLERLGHHLLSAQAHAEAIPHLLDAADVARRQGLLNRAIGLLDTAQVAGSDAPEDAPERLRAELLRGRVHFTRGDYTEAHACFERVLEHAPPDDLQAGHALRWLGRSFDRSGHIEQAEDCFQRAHAIFKSQRDARNVGRVLADHAFAVLSLGDTHRARTLANKALDSTRVEGLRDIAALCWQVIGRALRFEGALVEAQNTLLHALQAYSDTGRISAQASVWGDLGEVARATRDHAAAAEAYERSRELYERLGSGEAQTAELRLALVDVDRGLHQHTLGVLEELEYRFERQDRAILLTIAQLAAALCRLSIGDGFGAHQDWSRAWERVSRQKLVDPDIALYAQHLADALYAQRQHDSARSFYQLALEQWRALDNAGGVEDIQRRLRLLG